MSDTVEAEDDQRVVNLYDLIARLIPLEGRDYILKPKINDRGGISFSPEAHTEIGRIWVEYLAKVLPKLAAIPPELRDDFIARIAPRSLDYNKEEAADNGRAGTDGEAGRPGEDGKSEEPKTV